MPKNSSLFLWKTTKNPPLDKPDGMGYTGTEVKRNEYEQPGIQPLCQQPGGSVPPLEGYPVGVLRGRSHLRGGAGAVHPVPEPGGQQGRRGRLDIHHPDFPGLPAHRAGRVRQHRQAGGSGHPGAHHRLFQRHGIPGAGVQERGLRHRHRRQAVYCGGAGAGLWDLGQRGVRRGLVAVPDGKIEEIKAGGVGRNFGKKFLPAFNVRSTSIEKLLRWQSDHSGFLCASPVFAARSSARCRWSWRHFMPCAFGNARKFLLTSAASKYRLDFLSAFL